MKRTQWPRFASGPSKEDPLDNPIRVICSVVSFKTDEGDYLRYSLADNQGFVSMRAYTLPPPRKRKEDGPTTVPDDRLVSTRLLPVER